MSRRFRLYLMLVGALFLARVDDEFWGLPAWIAACVCLICAVNLIDPKDPPT